MALLCCSCKILIINFYTQSLAILRGYFWNIIRNNVLVIKTVDTNDTKKQFKNFENVKFILNGP